MPNKSGSRMSELKHKKVFVIEVTDRNLDAFFFEVYGFEYEIAAQHECSNGTNLSFDVDGKVYEFEEADLQKFKETGKLKMWSCGLLLNDLARQGIIEKGNYYVNVSW